LLRQKITRKRKEFGLDNVKFIDKEQEKDYNIESRSTLEINFPQNKTLKKLYLNHGLQLSRAMVDNTSQTMWNKKLNKFSQ